MSTSYYSPGSRAASSVPKEFDFQYFDYHDEVDYPIWMTPRRFINGLFSLPESVTWNAMLCLVAIASIVMLSMDYESESLISGYSISYYFDILYNLIYFWDFIARFCNDMHRLRYEQKPIEKINLLWYPLDVFSFSHYIAAIMMINDATLTKDTHDNIKMACYYVRMHRPLCFLWLLLDYYLIGDIVLFVLKYVYLFFVMHAAYANIMIWSGLIKLTDFYYSDPPTWLMKTKAKLFYRSFYYINQFSVAIGSDKSVEEDSDRLWSAMALISGRLVLAGITIAYMAIIISIYLRPKETFQSRFLLIMKEMESTNLPVSLSAKVLTFYQMYWHKQGAVSVTKLLPTYPHTLASAISTDIYFEALQKSRALRDLSYQFLSEISKVMQTINYVPGDIIVKRNSSKSAIIYIAYGDVEMLTAEDDETPILRFTRGSIINPCGCSVQVASTPAHVGIRAATFCTAHVLTAADLWRVTAKFGRYDGQSFVLQSLFQEHFKRVKAHYATRSPTNAVYKSSILVLKRNLMELKASRDSNDKLLLARTDVFLEIAGCYIMRNGKDTMLTEESDAICLRQTFPCILQPTSSLLIAWLTFVSLLTLLITFMYPYYFVFLNTVPQGFRFFDYLVSFVFILDIITNLSIGEKIEEGVPITFIHTSTRQIYSIWFAVDLISVAPIFEFIGTGYYVGLNKIIKILKVFRVLKQFEDVWVYRAKVLRFTAYCLVIITTCYLLAAFNQGVTCYYHEYCEVTSLTEAPYWSKTKANEENIENRLLFGLYWSISMMTFTTHKTSALVSKHWSMQGLVLIFFIICSKLHILLESTYSATFISSGIVRHQYTACVHTVKDFLILNKVNPVLRQRFIEYLHLCWYNDKAFSIIHGKKSILFDLPVHVYQDIMAMQRRKYIMCIPFMKYVNAEEVKLISSHARLFYTSPNEILLNTGDVSNEAYVIKHGFCEILSPVTGKVISLITARSHFGDLECLLRFPAFYTVRAVTHVQVLSISRFCLTKAMASPKLKDAITFARQQPEYTALLKGQDPFLMYEVMPPPPNRMMFPLHRKHEPDVAFLYPFNRLGFFSILRYVFPRFTIRPDGNYLRRYEWFRAFCAFLSAFICPLYTIIVLQWPEIEHFCWLLDITAYYDIFQRMLVGYFDEKGILVYHPASTAAHYLRGAFLVDLFACLPLETMDSIRLTIYRVDDGYRYPRTIQFFMFNRVLQLYRLPGPLSALENIMPRNDILYIVKKIPLVLTTISIATSLLALSSVKNYKLWNGGYRIEPDNDTHGVSWIIASAHLVGYNITETTWSLILTTFYWVTYEITTTGFNIFHPNKTDQFKYLIITMIFGTIISTYFSARVNSIRGNINQAQACFQQNTADMITFMKKEKFNKELRNEVISYYEYMWDKTGGTDYHSVLKMCDQITLRTDAILQIYGQTFGRCPILYHCEQSLLRVVGRAVRSCYYRENMKIIDNNEVVSDIYFVDQGVVEVCDENNYFIAKLPRGSLLGNLSIAKTALSRNNFVASVNVHLLKIDAAVFYEIIQEFSTVKLLLNKYRPHDESYIIGAIQGGTKKSITVWRDRSVSAIKLLVSQNRLLKYTHSKTMQIYLILVSIMCIFGDIYNAGFLNNDAILIGILYGLDVAFVVKIVVHYLLPFIADKENEYEDFSIFWKKVYCKGEFWADVLSCLPLEVFCLAHSSPWEAFVYLRLNRVLRAVTVSKCMQRYYQKLSVNLTLTSVIWMLIWFVLMVHSATCMWYLLSRIQESYEPKSSWRYNSEGKDWCQNQYMCALYFIVTTCTQNGVRDILPRQKSEVFFVIILMLVSNMMYMVFVGEFTNILLYHFYRCFSFFNKYLELQTFLRNNRVSKNLIDDTEKYTLYLWREARGRQVPRFLSAAPQCLRLKIMSAAYMHHLTTHPVFKKCEPAFLRHLVGCFQPFYYNENMYIVRDNEQISAMYFIHKGRVQEYDEEFNVKMKMFKSGEHFGLGLHHNTAYKFSYKTTIKSQVLTLLLKNWEYLLEHFPKNRDIIYSYKPGDDSNDKSDDKLDKDHHEKKRVKITKRNLETSSSSLGGETKTKKKGNADKVSLSSLPAAAVSAHSSNKPLTLPHTRSEGETKATTKNLADRPEFAPIPLSTSTPAVETNRWPMESRRSSTGWYPYKDDEDTKEIIKRKAAYSRRKSTIQGVDRAAVNEELELIDSTLSEPPTSEPEQKLISQLILPTATEDFTQAAASTLLKSPPTASEQDRWPMHSRHMSTASNSSLVKKGDTQTSTMQGKSSKDDLQLKPSYNRRKSTVKDVDRAAVNKELKSLNSPLILPVMSKLEQESVPVSETMQHISITTLLRSPLSSPVVSAHLVTLPLDSQPLSMDSTSLSAKVSHMKKSYDLRGLQGELKSKPDFNRRKSTVKDIDKVAVLEELKNIGSSKVLPLTSRTEQAVASTLTLRSLHVGVLPSTQSTTTVLKSPSSTPASSVRMPSLTSERSSSCSSSFSTNGEVENVRKEASIQDLQKISSTSKTILSSMKQNDPISYDENKSKKQLQSTTVHKPISRLIDTKQRSEENTLEFPITNTFDKNLKSKTGVEPSLKKFKESSSNSKLNLEKLTTSLSETEIEKRKSPKQPALERRATQFEKGIVLLEPPGENQKISTTSVVSYKSEVTPELFKSSNVPDKQKKKKEILKLIKRPNVQGKPLKTNQTSDPSLTIFAEDTNIAPNLDVKRSPSLIRKIKSAVKSKAHYDEDDTEEEDHFLIAQDKTATVSLLSRLNTEQSTSKKMFGSTASTRGSRTMLTIKDDFSKPTRTLNVDDHTEHSKEKPQTLLFKDQVTTIGIPKDSTLSTISTNPSREHILPSRSDVVAIKERIASPSKSSLKPPKLMNIKDTDTILARSVSEIDEISLSFASKLERDKKLREQGKASMRSLEDVSQEDETSSRQGPRQNQGPSK